MNFFKTLWKGIKTCGIKIGKAAKFIALKIAWFFKTISIFIWKKIKSPNKLALACFYMLYTALIALTLTLVIRSTYLSVFHYILFAVSAFSTAYFVYTLVLITPKIKNGIIALMKRHKFTNKVLSNYGYRAFMTSCFSFIFNIAFVIFQLVLAIKSGSAWYYSITAYFLILSFVKGSVFFSKLKIDTYKNELKTFRLTGIMFIFLTLALSGIIVLIYMSNMAFEYAGLAIYVVAAYTFLNLALSIYNHFKSKSQNSLYIHTLKNINLAHSCFSILVLQVALFQAFSPDANKSIANALTGGAVSLAILTIGVLMIAKANKLLKQLKQGTLSTSIEINLEESKIEPQIQTPETKTQTSSKGAL